MFSLHRVPRDTRAAQRHTGRRETTNSNDQFRRGAVPTFVIAGVAVVAGHVGGGAPAVRALAPDV